MEANYAKADDAVSWLEHDLETRCPQANIEVTVFEGGQSECKRFDDTLEAVLPLIRKAMLRFPQVEMQAHPRNVYGQYTLFVCACDEEGWERCPLKCKSFAERPKITVVVRSNGNNHVIHRAATGRPSAAAN